MIINYFLCSTAP